MPYDGSNNYKISARLKLRNRSIPTKFFIGTLFVIAVFAAGLFLSDAFRSKLYEIYYHTASSVYGGVNSINSSLSSRVGKVTHHFSLEEKYENLKAENQEFKDREIYYRRLASEIAKLKNVMKYSANDPKKILMTEILMQSSDGYVESARIPVGRIDGVKQGDIVADHEKLVGRITDVGERFSTITLVTSPNSKTPVFFEKTNMKAIVRGSYNGKMVVGLIHGKGALPVLGEVVSASGDGYNFISGLAVGTVTKDQEGQIEITPFSNIRNVRYVSILRD
jgi:rod shape-determining protein MreC